MLILALPVAMALPARAHGEVALQLWVATEARRLGRGGVSVVAGAVGMSRTTVYAGLAELDRGLARGDPAKVLDKGRVRVRGGVRKTLASADTTPLAGLDVLVEPTTRGDPQSALRWTCKSTTRLAQALNQQGHQVSQRTVCDLLAQMHYSWQSVRNTREGAQNSDRDAQFRYIAAMVAQYQRQRQPAISVDTKKKELIGDFKNAGREWQPAGQPEEARTHDFINKALDKVAPYGVYDVSADPHSCWGWVNIDNQRARSAAEATAEIVTRMAWFTGNPL